MDPTEVALSQLDAVLQEYRDAVARSQHDDLSDLGTELDALATWAIAAVERLAPPGSSYLKAIEVAREQWTSYSHLLLPSAIGAVEALRADYASGNLNSLSELIHADMFADFLEMADHLLGEGYKDAAAVLAGSTLEGHLRTLAEKLGLPTSNDAGEPLKAARLNEDLRKAGAYEKNDQKAVTAWLGLRNDAAHGNYGDYEAGQVGPMIAGIRDFIQRLPA